MSTTATMICEQGVNKSFPRSVRVCLRCSATLAITAPELEDLLNRFCKLASCNPCHVEHDEIFE